MNIIHYSRNGELSKALSMRAKGIIIAIDSQNFSIHQVTLPKMGKKKATMAIPFALESKLLDDIDLLHFEITKSSTQNTWDVFVIAKEVLQDIERELQLAKCKPEAVLPDFMLLPYVKEQVNYCESEGMTTFRDGLNQGGCIESKLFQQIYGSSDSIKANFYYSNKIKLNIQTGTSQKGSIQYLSPWRLPIVLAIIALLISIGQIWAKNNQLEEHLDLQRASNEEQFRALFPDVVRVVNIRVQSKQALEAVTRKNDTYRNDLLSKLSLEVFPNSQASKIEFNNQTLTVEVLNELE
jgi:type II secretory pathway component PulL